MKRNFEFQSTPVLNFPCKWVWKCFALYDFFFALFSFPWSIIIGKLTITSTSSTRYSCVCHSTTVKLARFYDVFIHQYEVLSHNTHDFCVFCPTKKVRKHFDVIIYWLYVGINKYHYSVFSEWSFDRLLFCRSTAIILIMHYDAHYTDLFYIFLGSVLC